MSAMARLRATLVVLGALAVALTALAEGGPALDQATTQPPLVTGSVDWLVAQFSFSGIAVGSGALSLLAAWWLGRRARDARYTEARR